MVEAGLTENFLIRAFRFVIEGAESLVITEGVVARAFFVRLDHMNDGEPLIVVTFIILLFDNSGYVIETELGNDSANLHLILSQQGVDLEPVVLSNVVRAYRLCVEPRDIFLIINV